MIHKQSILSLLNKKIFKKEISLLLMYNSYSYLGDTI